MDLRYVVDVSSFFLVESSGDSEANLDSISSMDYNIIVPAEDDAESCCGSSNDVVCMDDCNDTDDQGYSEEDGHCQDDDTSPESYRDLINGNWRTWQELGLLLDDASGSMQQTEQKKQPKGRADVSADMMNEEEQNKLFWDTCLAL